MKTLARIVALALLLPLCGPAAARNGPHEDDASEINLPLGGQKVIPSIGVQSFSEGVPGIIQVKLPEDGRHMVVSGLKAGSTTLLLIYANGRQQTLNINVYPRSPQAVRTELRSLLSGLTSVEIREAGGRLFLDGAVATNDDLERIGRIVEMYGGQVASFVTVDPARQTTNIKLDLHFVELRKTSSYNFGVNWPGNFGAHPEPGTGQPSASFLYTYNFLTRSATLGQITVAENLLPSLDILGVRGWAKIHNVVSVVTTNGGTATYHTGGEVNVKVASSLGPSTLQKIPFGVELTVQPRLDPQSGAIVVTIQAEQSQLQPIAGQDVPGRVLTSTRTNVHLRVGQSAMLSGFKESTDQLNASGIPGLMRIPLLGYLFRTESGSSSETDTVLFITPTVIENSSPDSHRRIEEALERFEEFGSHVAY